MAKCGGTGGGSSDSAAAPVEIADGRVEARPRKDAGDPQLIASPEEECLGTRDGGDAFGVVSVLALFDGDVNGVPDTEIAEGRAVDLEELVGNHTAGGADGERSVMRAPGDLAKNGSLAGFLLGSADQDYSRSGRGSRPVGAPHW